jgi:sarcosine oxidase subunit alpha
MSRREGMLAERRRLVGLQPVDAQTPIAAGAHLFTQDTAQSTSSDQGWITSACYSPHLGSMIGLGFLERGDERLGEIIVGANPLEGKSALLRVVSPHFVDPEGGRVRD